MMLDKHNIKYIKHNRARLKAGKREESTQRLLQFFGGLEGSRITECLQILLKVRERYLKRCQKEMIMQYLVSKYRI